MRAIDADAFVRKIRKQYCEDCVRRKGIKNGKMQYLYEIGGVPCRACEIEDMLNEVEDAPPIQPEPHWIPVEQALPEEPFGCLVTVMDTNPVTMEEFENILPYFVGWDGEQWNDADGEQCPFEVIAWMPLPESYKGVSDGRD